MRFVSIVTMYLLSIGVLSVFAQNINTPENFPDPNFRAAVEEYMGVEPGGEFTAEEASNKKGALNCDGPQSPIQSLQGIEYFNNITELSCNNNSLSSIDLTAVPDLKILWCSNNKISSLNLSHLPNLVSLNCELNNLKQLDISNNPLLTWLSCYGNHLTKLDIHHNPELETLECSYNELSKLDISNNPRLSSLKMINNDLTSINPYLNHLSFHTFAFDIRWNNLGPDDWQDVQMLAERLDPPEFFHEKYGLIDYHNVYELRSGFAYSPQQNYDPYDFSDQDPQLDITPTPTQPQQPFLEWEFPFEAEEEFTHIPGGFEEADAGRMALEAIPTGPASFTDGFGARLSARQGQVELLLFPELAIGEQIALIRVSVMAEAPGASVALAAVDGSLDGSMATNIPANSDIYTGGYHRMTMTYNTPGETVRPIVQLANLNAEGEVTVYFDNLEVYVIPRNVQIPSNLLYGEEEGFTPPPVITNTPTPTPTMDEPTPVIPTVQPPSKKEITIDLPNLPDNAKPLEMVYIEPGTFMMGSTEEEIQNLIDETGDEWFENESPRHQVILTKGFYMGKYEVTVGQYATFLEATRKESGVGWNNNNCPLSRNKGNYSLAENDFSTSWNQPMVVVSWYGAAMFCNYLSEKEGLQPVYTESGEWKADMNADGYRLPTEAEWEYACRAGTQTRFYWGDDPAYNQIDDYAWFGDGTKTKKVGQKLPNAWGLYDMCGNAWEWCNDYFDNNYYANSPVQNPIGPNTGTTKVGRGGDWGSDEQLCRSAHRDWGDPVATGGDDGFRIVREINRKSITPPPVITNTPTPTPTPTEITSVTTNFHTVDLSKYYNAKLDQDWQTLDRGNNLSNLPKGQNDYCNVPFVIHGVIQLNGKGLNDVNPIFPKEIMDIDINRKCNKVHFFHGIGWSEDNGVPVGMYKMNYGDGSSQIMELQYGIDVTDWWYRPESGLIPEDSCLAWTGTNDATEKNSSVSELRLYKSAWVNPHPSKVIKSIDFVSTYSFAAPFLLGITIEKYDSPPKPITPTPTSTSTPTEEGLIPDPNFEEVIRNELNGYKGTLTPRKLLRIKNIVGKVENIKKIAGVEYCTYLETLWLDDNQISSIKPIKNLVHLRHLSFPGNQVRDISAIEKLVDLKYLTICQNQITDISPLSNLTALRELEIYNNPVQDITPLSNLTNLEALTAHSNNIEDLSFLSNLTKVTELHLNWNSIDDLSPISHLQLEGLWLEDNQIQDITPLEDMTTIGGHDFPWLIKDLNLKNNQIQSLLSLIKNKGIDNPDVVDLRENPLNDESVNKHIPDLLDRGVVLLYKNERPPQGAPDELEIKRTSRSEYQLNWQDNSNEELGFLIRRRAMDDWGQSWYKVKTVSPNTTEFVDTNVARSDKFEYQVFAYNASGFNPHIKIQ